MKLLFTASCAFLGLMLASSAPSNAQSNAPSNGQSSIQSIENITDHRAEISQTGLPTLSNPSSGIPIPVSPLPATASPVDFPAETRLPAVNETPLPEIIPTALPAIEQTDTPAGPGFLYVDSVRSANRAGRLTGSTVLSFRTGDYTVTVTRAAEDLFMSVYNQRTSTLEVENVPAVEIGAGAGIEGIAARTFVATVGDRTYTAYEAPNTVNSLLISSSTQARPIRILPRRLIF